MDRNIQCHFADTSRHGGKRDDRNRNSSFRRNRDPDHISCRFFFSKSSHVWTTPRDRGSLLYKETSCCSQWLPNHSNQRNTFIHDGSIQPLHHSPLQASSTGTFKNGIINYDFSMKLVSHLFFSFSDTSIDEYNLPMESRR